MVKGTANFPSALTHAERMNERLSLHVLPGTSCAKQYRAVLLSVRDSGKMKYGHSESGGKSGPERNDLSEC